MSEARSGPRAGASRGAVYRGAVFVGGAARAAQLPPDRGREVAFCGRSNAGKSSAINALTGQRSLARVSKTPGRTREINFFRLDEERRLVDLPGYGFARVPGTVQRRWAELVEGYLLRRRSLRGVVVLMDVRRPLTDLDARLLEWCRSGGVPTHVLLTKADKLGRGARARALELAARRLRAVDESATAQLFSATTALGLEELWMRLDGWLGVGDASGGAGARTKRDPG